jgi:uncharacterized damage-inducible protein DinB
MVKRGRRRARHTEQFMRDLHGSFRSLRDTLVHIIGGEWGWLAYWKEPVHSSTFLTDLRMRRNVLFNLDAFPNVAAVQLKWEEVEKEQAEFVNRLTDESLGKMLPFHKTQIGLAHLVQHLANHSTYHRGQVALMMRQLDAEPLATDFHVFLVEGRRERRLGSIEENPGEKGTRLIRSSVEPLLLLSCAEHAPHLFCKLVKNLGQNAVGSTVAILASRLLAPPENLRHGDL